MLTITIPATDAWDERIERFVKTPETTLVLQHSLVSLSKWEARFKKPFLSPDKKSEDETYGYIQAMSESPVDVDILRVMTQENLEAINEYIEDPHTATTIKEAANQRRSREIVTNEVIYHWMWALQIPMEAQFWHLNRLFTAIRVVNEKQQKPKKMGRAEQLAQQRRLNAERLERLGTSG